jgi:hypothetical protein
MVEINESFDSGVGLWLALVLPCELLSVSLSGAKIKRQAFVYALCTYQLRGSSCGSRYEEHESDQSILLWD